MVLLVVIVMGDGVKLNRVVRGNTSASGRRWASDSFIRVELARNSYSECPVLFP